MSRSYLMTPLLPTSASELLTRSTSVPVGASSVMVVWNVDAVKTGALSLTSLTKTVTVDVPLREGTPGDGEGEEHNRELFHFSTGSRVPVKPRATGTWRRPERHAADLSYMTCHLLRDQHGANLRSREEGYDKCSCCTSLRHVSRAITLGFHQTEQRHINTR